MFTVIEAVAADKRQHRMAHIAPWLSFRDLIDETKVKCSSDVDIPSKAMVDALTIFA